PRAHLGTVCAEGELLQSAAGPRFELTPGVAARWLDPREHRDYLHPPVLRVWPAPQWALLAEAGREQFFQQEWTVTAQNDRVGYRLAGEPIRTGLGEMISEPVRVGTIQIPDNGQPIITMRDGPTVGGYPKLGMVDLEDLSWLAQCRPGQH